MSREEGAELQTAVTDYVLEDQIGHLLRRAHQRASAIFMARFAALQLTPTQYAALVKIRDEGEVSQNRLGRLTAMDPATMKGVIERLERRGLARQDPRAAGNIENLLARLKGDLAEEQVGQGFENAWNLVTFITLGPTTL